MNYLRISRDLGCENISDVRITIGNRYILSASTNNDSRNTELLLSDFLSNIKRINDKVLLEDNFTGEILGDRIEDIGEYVSQRNISLENDASANMNIELIPLTFKEQLWKHLVNKYEYLRANNEGNFDRFKEFIDWLMELLCEQYEQKFLKELDDDNSNMEFAHYIKHTIDTLDSIIRQKTSLSEDYFQKQYYLLKEELASQEKQLCTLFRIPLDSNLIDITEKAAEQQASMSHSISNIIKDIDYIRESSDISRITQCIEITKTTLAAMLKDLPSNLDFKRRERKEIIDGYFLPFHRVRTRTNMRDSKGSRRSASLQNSKNMVSERISYDSYSRQLLTSRLNLGSSIRDNGNIKRLRKNYSDYSINRRDILEDPNDNAYSVNEVSPIDLKDLLKYKEILIELGFNQDILNDSGQINTKINDYISLSHQCEVLDAHCIKLSEHIKLLSQDSNRSGFKDINYHNEVTRNLESRIQESNDKAKIIYDDYVIEKNNVNELRTHCATLEQNIIRLQNIIIDKEELYNALFIKNNHIIYVLKESIVPKIQAYRTDIEELTSLISDGYVQNLMETYKKLKDRKLELSDELIDFLKTKCEQFVVNLEHATKIDKVLVHNSGFTSKILRIVKSLDSRFKFEYNNALDKIKNRLHMTNDKLLFTILDIKTKQHKLHADNMWLSDELQMNIRQCDEQAKEHNFNIEKIQEQYKIIIADLNRELEEKTNVVNSLLHQIETSKTNQNIVLKDLRHTLDEYKADLTTKENKLIKLTKVIQDQQNTIDINRVSSNKLETSYEISNIDDELEKLNIMNSKLVGEIEILTKRTSQQKTEIETLNQQVYNQEDLNEKIKELSLSNKILEGKIEMLESYKMVEETDLTLGAHQSSDRNNLLENRLSDRSIKNSNKTIHEVDEDVEKSSFEQSIDLTKVKNPPLSYAMRETGSSLYKPKDIKKVELITTINTNYTFVHNKDDSREYDSPGSSNIKKNIFSANSIIKNIEALKKSTNSFKFDDVKASKDLANEFSAFDKHKIIKMSRLLDIVNLFTDNIKISTCVDKVVCLEGRVKQLQLLLTDNDIESLARPKRDSNLRALTDRSHSSKSQSYYVENEELEEDDSNRKLSSPLKVAKNAYKTDKLNDVKNKQLNKINKRSGRLEKIIKPHTTISPAKKAQLRQNKELVFKNSKLSSNSSKSNKKIIGRSGVDIEAVDKNLAMEWQRMEDELRSHIDQLNTEKNNLISELDFSKEKGQKEEQILQKAFNIALPLIEEQIEDDVDLNPLYLDQVMEIVKTKINRYEEALDSLQQEIESLRQEYADPQEEEINTEIISIRMDENKSLVEVDLEGNQTTERQRDAEQMNDMKKAFDELICEMFTVTADNIDNITNLEGYLNEEADNQGDMLQGITKDDINAELDKIKTYTMRLKEMIEVLYENLMTYMNDIQTNKPQSATLIDDISLANLQAENEYLCKRLETFNDNYQDLNKKYLQLLSDKNTTLGKCTSTPELDLQDEKDVDQNLKDKMKKFIQNNINFKQSPADQLNEQDNREEEVDYDMNVDNQVYQLTYLLRRINQIIKSDNSDNYKIMKIEDILENPEAQ